MSYALECELDHTVTWIAGLVERVTDGHIDRRLLESIGEEQVDLGRYLANLEEVHITPEVKSRLQTYIRLTQALLSKIEAVCLKNLEHRST